MEGICGIVSFGANGEGGSAQIESMCDSLSDGEPLKIFTVGGSSWWLGSAGWVEDDWPSLTLLYQDEGLAVVGVADLYNTSELAKKYRVHEDDTGRILALCYRSDEQEWLLRLRGSFSVILLDISKQKLIAATDRVGLRPLYWYREGNTYFLSSRVSAIYRVCSDLEIDPTAIYEYMHHGMIPSPNTVYRDVYKLEAGSSLRAGPRGMQVLRYWDISVSPKICSDEASLARDVYDVIEYAVSLMRNRIADDEEIACFLSGGTDSSSICGLLSKIVRKPVAAYSIGFSEDGYDEVLYARTAARAFGLAHREYYMKPEEVLTSLSKIALVYDEPFDNSSVFPAYLCCRLAAENGARFMFAGDGGDEIFAGNERYGVQRLFRRYLAVPSFLRNGIIEPILLGRLKKLPFGVVHRAESYVRRAKLPDIERIYSYRYVTDCEMFSGDYLAVCDTERLHQLRRCLFERLTGADPLDRHLYLDMKLTITDNDLRKVSRMCDLAHVRPMYPMLDQGVIELGFRIPAELKLKGTLGLRYIFKRAFDGFLPEEILKKRKHGFGLPISRWLRNDARIREFAHSILFDERHLRRGYFRPEFVRKLWEQQQQDTTAYYGSVVWQLVMLEVWHRIHFDKQGIL